MVPLVVIINVTCLLFVCCLSFVTVLFLFKAQKGSGLAARPLKVTLTTRPGAGAWVGDSARSGEEGGDGDRGGGAGAKVRGGGSGGPEWGRG